MGCIERSDMHHRATSARSAFRQCAWFLGSCSARLRGFGWNDRGESAGGEHSACVYGASCAAQGGRQWRGAAGSAVVFLSEAGRGVSSRIKFANLIHVLACYQRYATARPATLWRWGTCNEAAHSLARHRTLGGDRRCYRRADILDRLCAALAAAGSAFHAEVEGLGAAYEQLDICEG